MQACLNGGRSRAEHPRLPISASDLALDASAAIAAGARSLHVHPRDASGAETLEPGAVTAALAAIRAACDAPVGVGTGAWIAPGGSARRALIAAWPRPDMGGPDFASVNLNEPDAPAVTALLAGRGIGVEAGLWTVADAERFVAALADGRIAASACLRALIEMTEEEPGRALETARAIRDILDRAEVALPILLHGAGGSVWACVAEAARWGVATRVGFEDGLHTPDGALAADNAALVRAAAHGP
ncbi:MAG: 3-keto-5-aminohexanoate cleavage protein [Pseudomonadota bacterium]